ncbi:futalosine hydrolase [Desulfothermus okinawensis JCM 13304]
MGHLLICAATKREIRTWFPEIPDSLKMGDVHLIKFKKKKFYIQVCGIGPINSAIFLERAILKHNLTGVINIGIAGSFDISKIPIGAITIAREEIWPEYGLKQHGIVDPKGLKYGLIKKNNRIIYNHISIPIEENINKMGLSFSDNFYTTTNLTVAGVTGTEPEARAMEKMYGADVENMEGFSVAYVCLIHEVPFIEIRTISNQVGCRDTHKWDIKKALQELKKAKNIIHA